MSSTHKKKFFSLVPFMIEAAFVNKYWVLNLDYIPSHNMLKFKLLTLGGVRMQYMPVDHMIPINRHDYWNR